MKIREKIVLEMKDYFDDDTNEFDASDIDGFSLQLEQKGITNYCLCDRNNGTDYWIQAEGYINTKRKGFTIIFDYDCQSGFSDRNEFVDYIIEKENEFQSYQKALKNIKINL